MNAHRHWKLRAALTALITLALNAAVSIVIFGYAGHDRERSSIARCGLVLTYDNRGLNDGAGAQVQRILSLYLIASNIGAGYAHTPIAKVIYQGLDALAANATVPMYEARWNEAFELPSLRTQGCTNLAEKKHYGDDGCVHVLESSLSSLAALEETRRRSCVLRAPIVLHATFAHEITDAAPSLLDASGQFQALLPWVRQARGEERAPSNRRALRIAIHVRRGDLQFRQAYRQLPNAYYVQIALELSGTMKKLRIPWEVDVYSEGLTQEITIQPNQVGLVPKELADPITVSPDGSLSRDFRVVRGARMRMNGDALEVMRSLVAADVLVISPSSFSYVAGLVRQRGEVLVIYHPFWHEPRSDWFCMSPFRGSALDRRDVTRLRRRIAADFEHQWRAELRSRPAHDNNATLTSAAATTKRERGRPAALAIVQ